MKKALVFLAVVLSLSSVATAELDLSSYSSGELRELVVAAKEEADVRFAEIGPAIAEKFVEIMNENGYRIEIGDENDNYFKFVDLDNPSFFMTLMHNAACVGSIEGDITSEYLRVCFSAMVAAVAHTEGNPKIRSVQSYAELLEKKIPFDTLPVDISCTRFLDGYLCSLMLSSESMSGYTSYGYNIS